MLKRKARGGFTLIELLVVIAIIAILAAILFPIFANAKERARQVTCLNNLKQLAQGIQQYSDDNAGRVPLSRVATLHGTAYDWAGCYATGGPCTPQMGGIWRYVKSEKSYLCPTDSRTEAKGISTPPSGVTIAEYRKRYPLSYSMNSRLFHTIPETGGTGYPVNMGSIASVKDCLLLIHENHNTINDGDFRWPVLNDMPSNIHYEGTTAVYCDSHAMWRSTLALKAMAKPSDAPSGHPAWVYSKWEPMPSQTIAEN